MVAAAALLVLLLAEEVVQQSWESVDSEEGEEQKVSVAWV